MSTSNSRQKARGSDGEARTRRSINRLHPLDLAGKQYRGTPGQTPHYASAKKKYYQILTDSSRKLFLSKEGFEFLTSTPLAKLRKDNRALRDILDRAVDKAQAAIKDSTLGGKKPFSFAEFERKYLGADANRNFLVFFKKHIDRLLAKGHAGTARAYSSAYSALKEFYNNIDFDPADLTAERLHDFDE